MIVESYNYLWLRKGGAEQKMSKTSFKTHFMRSIIFTALAFMFITVAVLHVNVVLAAEEGDANDVILEAEAVATEDDLELVRLTAYVRELQYLEYLASFVEESRPDVEIRIPAASYTNATSNIQYLENFQGAPGISVRTDERGYLEWEVEVPESGLYNMDIMYYPVSGRSSSIERGLYINGERPFAEAAFLTFFRVWGDAEPFRIDNMGNHVRARQEEKPMWQRVNITDPLGYERNPFLFYFNEGKNVVRWEGITEPMIINELRIRQFEEMPLYADLAVTYADQGLKPVPDVFIKVQGQDSIYRSAPTLFPEFDQGDPTVEPYHEAQIRLNSIGGHRWRDVGDWIAWEVDVPQSGLYQIAFKAKQDQRRGFYSSRRLLINGKVPFKEADAIRFPYSQFYEMSVIGSENGPAYVYLEEGRNEIRLEVVLGDLAELLSRTEDTLYELNTIYRRIIMITSATPDPMRSYQLEVRIPGLIERLQIQSGLIEGMADELFAVSGERGGHTAVLESFARMLEDMANRPYRIPRRLGEFRDNVGALGTWIMQTRAQPLQVDYFIVASPDKPLPRANPTTFQTLTHEVRSFISSFTHDYNRVGDFTETEAERDEMLRVWIGAGRDQAQVLKQMIEDSFTATTGITVDFELIEAMDQLLIPVIIANRAPDVALGAANMDLAFRGALTDLSQFDDFDEVATRFMHSAFLPFRFRDKVFALPEIQGFPMLFYRKDVLEELGLEVPETWEDVYAIIPELQKENMEFGIRPNMQTYQMFLYQKGIPLFKEDVIETNLDSESAVAVFDQLTDLFTLYNLPLEFNAENRFRMGEMPLVIENYGLFNTLSVFAPELRGEWGFTTVPGTRMEDGTIARTVPVAGTVVPPGAVAVPPGTSGAVILNQSDKKDEAWEFLKWWTSTETQVRFGREMESLMGAAARYASANVEALQQLPWRAEERDLLVEQWTWVEGVPAVLGGYYVNRQFDWLFRAVVLQNRPLRESILDYDQAANEEIARKREEFGLVTKRDQISPELEELYWSHYSHLFRLEDPADRY